MLVLFYYSRESSIFDIDSEKNGKKQKSSIFFSEAQTEVYRMSEREGSSMSSGSCSLS